jgi:hypothetical protein
MWKAVSHCPCSVRIPMRYRRRMTNIFGTRKSVPCLHCGILITWSKSNRIFLIGCWLVFVLACLGFLLEVLNIYDGIISFIILCIVWLLYLLLAIPLFTVKLEISDLDEQDESQEKVR